MSTLNMNQPAKKILVDMLNNGNIKAGHPKRFTVDDVKFSHPRLADISQPVNTEIDMTLVDPQPEDGENTPYTLYYDRLDFHNVFTKYSAEFEFIDGMTNVYDVMDYINDRTGLNVEAEDLLPMNVSLGDFPRYVIVAAHPNSLIFRGQANLILTGENAPTAPPVTDPPAEDPPVTDPPAEDGGDTTP